MAIREQYSSTDGSKKFFDYTPFGAEINSNYNDPNGWIASERDPESKYMNLCFRLYDPAIGRFLSVDPLFEIQIGVTPYHYCGNDPVNAKDPSGLWGAALPGLPNPHGDIARRALAPFQGVYDISNKDVEDFARGAVDADKSQGENEQYIHSLLSGDFTDLVEAKKMRQDFIGKNVDKFRETGNFYYLGLASHPIADYPCPIHSWKDYNGKWGYIITGHYFGDLPIFSPDAYEESINLVSMFLGGILSKSYKYDYNAERKRMIEDLKSQIQQDEAMLSETNWISQMLDNSINSLGSAGSSSGFKMALKYSNEIKVDYNLIQQSYQYEIIGARNRINNLEFWNNYFIKHGNLDFPI